MKIQGTGVRDRGSGVQPETRNPKPETRNPRRLAPLDTVEPADCVALPSAGRVECGVCSKTFCASAVVDDAKPTWMRSTRCWSVTRRLHCDHCQHIQCWAEEVKLVADGFYPTGLVLMGPGFVRGRRALERFLRQHPQAAGVI
jgi:hypothetical protein